LTPHTAANKADTSAAPNTFSSRAFTSRRLRAAATYGATPASAAGGIVRMPASAGFPNHASGRPKTTARAALKEAGITVAKNRLFAAVLEPAR